MAGKLVNDGENRIADIIFGATAVDSSLYLGLYTNSSEPAEGDSLSSITVPSGSANGYAAITLSRGSWTVTNDNAAYAQQTFTASGGDWGNVYGYYIATSTDGTGVLLFVETFSDGPYNVTDGDSVKITPSITVA